MMNVLLLEAMIIALSGASDWPDVKYKNFCHDVLPLLHRKNIGYKDLCPVYDKYIHRLDKIDMLLKEIEK